MTPVVADGDPRGENRFEDQSIRSIQGRGEEPCTVAGQLVKAAGNVSKSFEIRGGLE